jgi:hypothetical protein
MGNLGVGLTGVAFWAFLAAVVVAETWAKAKNRAADREMLRRLIESGKPIDQSLLDQVLGERKERPDRGLKIGGIIVLSLAPGMVIFGLMLGQNDAEIHPMIGIGGLLACLGVGLLVASVVARKSLEEDERSAGTSSKES